LTTKSCVTQQDTVWKQRPEGVKNPEGEAASATLR
jgi:hypothetical protein